MILDLDSAIQHCEEVAEDQEQYYNQDGTELFYVKHSKCASEHRQLAEWLKLLKRILESGDCNDCAIQKMCNVRPEWGERVRYNCHMFVRKKED